MTKQESKIAKVAQKKQPKVKAAKKAAPVKKDANKPAAIAVPAAGKQLKSRYCASIRDASAIK